MSQTLSYRNVRDLLTGMSYKRGNTGVASRTYTYDAAGRPITRNTSGNGTTVNDSFAYNNRSELTAATVNNEAYSYDYDNIGNRTAAVEDSSGVASHTAYTANNLNQYTAIGDFTPTFDAAGNQTLVKTTSGIWSVTYDAENRPVNFTNTETNTVIECAYDHMGRRATKKVTVNGAVTLHHRYLYRGYLQIDSGAPHCAFTLSGQTLRVCPTGLTAVVRFACCDLTRSNHPCLWLITWDPTQPIATRPLAIQKDGTWYTYGWDLTKNICELYGQHGYIRTNYTYTPYGEVTESGNSIYQPIQWSSEYNDTELGLVYYNYRHYNPMDGRWIGRDSIGIRGDFNLYCYVGNSFSHLDVLGDYMLPYNPIGGLPLRWNCATARAQLINQIAEWKQMGHNTAAYFMEMFLDPDTPDLVEVKGELLNELNRVGKEQMCNDFADIYSENGAKIIELSQIKLRYFVGYMRNAYGGVRFTGKITQLNENEINIKGKLEDYYVYSTGLKAYFSSLVNVSYDAALYLEENCSKQIKTFHTLANINFSCCLDA